MNIWDDLILCYVRENKEAFFTNRSLDEVWGDNWNDIQYEHNAGIPDYFVLKVYIDSTLVDPASFDGYPNSSWSVKMINKKITPWLRTSKYQVDRDVRDIQIFAGATYRQFKKAIHESGGTIYEPLLEGG